MKPVSDVVFCIVDHGLFAVPWAQRLAKEAKHVYLHTPWEEGFSTINKAIIGDGFAGIERCNDIWKIKNKVDCFVFPDIQHSGLQLELESQGFPVWGARAGDSQELDRELFLKTLKRVGLEVPEHEVVTGLPALRQALRDKEECYIKISFYRGSLETTHFRSWHLDKELLDLWGLRFGPAGDHIRFLVFESIDTPLEIGGDTYCIDGQWPSLMLHGVEWKDEAYFASVSKREEMPEQLQEVMEAFGPVLGEKRYRSQWSMECRVEIEGEKRSFFIDPTCRGGLPSTGSQLELWKNWPEIVWAGAHGELVDPEPAAKFSAESILTIKGDKTQWGVTEIPPELEQWIKLSNACEIEGRTCFPPDDSGSHAIGWLVAIGDTPEETIKKMNEQADLLPSGLNANTECLAYVLQEIHTAEEQGIEFSKQETPPPEIVLESA